MLLFIIAILHSLTTQIEAMITQRGSNQATSFATVIIHAANQRTGSRFYYNNSVTETKSFTESLACSSTGINFVHVTIAEIMTTMRVLRP